MSPEDLVIRGLVDPIKVFIKQEPHKLAKVKAGKLRIISNVSIVDQLIERILCSKQNKVEIKRWRTCPSKPGMGLHDEGLEEIFAEVMGAQKTYALAETDISGWDWNVKNWMLALDAKIRSRLYHAPPESALAVLLWFRGFAVARKVFCCSDGSLHSQEIPGIQASGSFNTSSTNSRMRVFLAWLIGCVWVIAMGDDDLEDVVDDARQKYADLGIVAKDYRVLSSPGWFNFCSTSFEGTPWGYPSNWLRIVYRYLSHSPASHVQNPEFAAQLAGDLRHHPSKREILDSCDSLVGLESKQL